MFEYPAFRGNWNTLWVAGRYGLDLLAGATPSKLANAGLAMAEMQLARARPRSLPFMVRLEPTGICNLRCPRCATGLGIDPRPKGFLSMEALDRVIDQVEGHAMVVRFDGLGEPLLHPRIVEAVRRLKAAGMGVVISTHFNNLPREGIDALVESGLDRLMIAVDGSTQETYERYRRGGELERVLHNMEALRQAKKKVGARKPLVDLQFLDWGYNHHQIDDMRSMAHRFDCDRLTVIEPDQAVSLRALPKNPKRCFWLWTVLTVDWQLDLHSCTNAWTYSFPKLNLGDQTLQELWLSDAYQAARQFNKDKTGPIDGEKDCMCRQCTDMLVVARPPGYVCE